MAIKTRSRLYIDCPYCNGKRKGRIGSIYEYGPMDVNSVFVVFERCPFCKRQTEARLGFIREKHNGEAGYTPEVHTGREQTGRRGSGRRVQKPRTSNK